MNGPRETWNRRRLAAAPPPAGTPPPAELLCATRGTLPAWQTRWRVDGGRWQVGNLLTLRRPGTSHVQYYSVDTAGLHEIVRKLAVRIVR